MLLPPGPDAHTIPCVPSRNGLSFSPSPVKVLQSIPTRLQSLILHEFLLPLPDTQVGKPDVGLRTFTPVGGLLWYKCSPVCESPTQQFRGFDFTLIAPLLPSHCPWTWSILLGEVQCLPVDDCPAASCDFGALARGSESMSFYSTILVNPLYPGVILKSLFIYFCVCCKIMVPLHSTAC